MSANSREDRARLSTTDVCRTIQTELQNMGRALTCPLCLSTYRNAVILSNCCHAYCSDCLLLAVNQQPKCPTCQQKCQRRSLVEAPLLNELVQAYKLSLRHFGLAPIRYEPTAPMTQLADHNNNNGTQNSQDFVNAHEHLQVARTFAQSLRGSSDRKSIALLQEQQQVIGFNERALVAAAAAARAHREPSYSQIVNSSLEQQTADAAALDENSKSQVTFARDNDRKMPAKATTSPTPASQDDPFYSAVEDVVETTESATASAAVETTEAETTASEKQASATTSYAPVEAANPSSEETVDPDVVAKQPFDFSGIESDSDQKPAAKQRRRMRSTVHTCGIFNSDADDRNILSSPKNSSNKERESPEQAEGEAVVGDETMADAQDCTRSVEENKSKANQAATDEPEAAQERETATEDASMQESTSDQKEASRDTAMEDVVVTENVVDNQESHREADTADADVPMVEAADAEEDGAAAARGTVGEVAARQERVSRETAPPESDSESEPVDMTTEARIQRARPVAVELGSVVSVQARTWPGVNKQGGVGRVTRVHELPGGSVAYDVAYVLGGREKKVDDAFVSLQEDDLGTTVEEEPEEGGRGRKSHRIAKKEEEIPPHLLQQLAAEGFDTKGDASSRRTVEVITPAEAKENSKPAKTERDKKAKRKKQAENEEQAQPSKRRKIGKAISSRLTKLVSRGRGEKSCTATAAIPDISNEEKCATADVLYKNRIESAMKKFSIHVVASGLSDHDMESLRALCKQMKKSKVKVTLSESFQPKKTTMCILPVNPRSSSADNPIAGSRTVKAMQAVLAGVPVVSTAWISSCRQAKAACVPSSCMFIRSLPIKSAGGGHHANANADYGVASVAAAIQQSNGSSSFSPLLGHFVHLCGHFSRRKQADILLLLRQSGAEILSHPAAVPAKVRAVSSDGGGGEGGKVVFMFDDDSTSSSSGTLSALERDAKRRHNKENVMAVTCHWLFDSISCGRALPPGAYAPPRSSGGHYLSRYNPLGLTMCKSRRRVRKS